MKAENAALVKETAAKDPVFREVLESQEAYIPMVREWTRISDHAYLKDNISE